MTANGETSHGDEKRARALAEQLAKLANGLAAAGSSITELRKGDGRACGDAGRYS